MGFKYHTLYEIFRHEQARIANDAKLKDLGLKVTYDEEKDILRYSNADGTATVTFKTEGNVKNATALYYKFNNDLHPVGSVFHTAYDDIFDEYHDWSVPENDEDCKYGFKKCDIFPYAKEGCVGKWVNSEKNTYQYIMDLAGDWMFEGEKVGLVYSQKELEMLRD